ncbi:MAG: hypothetical protein UT66_C0046G0005 [candidate division CPR2 bacterium GW2011_GWC1_39_9]|nr:MAG: hypothetical protein UT66_C0046G0005 [candidate division CPR2 bacterium GW2011_GWC1_39_9]
MELALALRGRAGMVITVVTVAVLDMAVPAVPAAVLMAVPAAVLMAVITQITYILAQEVELV